ANALRWRLDDLESRLVPILYHGFRALDRRIGLILRQSLEGLELQDQGGRRCFKRRKVCLWSAIEEQYAQLHGGPCFGKRRAGRVSMADGRGRRGKAGPSVSWPTD